jgi:hypothetical protein
MQHKDGKGTHRIITRDGKKAETQDAVMDALSEGLIHSVRMMREEGVFPDEMTIACAVTIENISPGLKVVDELVRKFRKDPPLPYIVVPETTIDDGQFRIGITMYLNDELLATAKERAAARKEAVKQAIREEMKKRGLDTEGMILVPVDSPEQLQGLMDAFKKAKENHGGKDLPRPPRF